MLHKHLHLNKQHMYLDNFNNLIIKFSLRLSQMLLLLLLRNINQQHSQVHMLQQQRLIQMEMYRQYIRYQMNMQHNQMNKLHKMIHQKMELILQHMNMLLLLHFRMRRNKQLQQLKFLKQYINLLRLYILHKNQLMIYRILINIKQQLCYLNKFLLLYHKHYMCYQQNIKEQYNIHLNIN